MINSVNFNSYIPVRNQDSKGDKKPDLSRNKVSFGDYYYYQDESVLDKVRNGFLAITSSALGLVGFNAALWFIQEKVNNGLLIGKINKHYTDKIKDDNLLKNMAGEMLEKHGLANTVSASLGTDGEAYYTAIGNKIVIGKDKASALFHEIGHAVIENNTKILKKLQNFRGNYTFLALALYALMPQHRTQNYDMYGRRKKEGLFEKIKNLITNPTVIVPLAAFSPELITEAKASKIGLKFLKEKVKSGAIEKSLYKNIKKSYLACFSTYLFIPVSIIIMDALQNSVDKYRQRRRIRQEQYYY